MSDSRWLDWAREIAAHAQSALAYDPDPYDRERFERLRELAAEIVAVHSGLPQPQIADWFAAEQGYATPKVDVRMLVLRGDSLLLIKEQTDGRWALPGGWMDVGDSPAEAAARELREEAGLEAQTVRLLGVFDNRRHGLVQGPWHIIKLCFGCEADGEPTAGSEATAAGFFRLGALPELSLNRNTPQLIERLVALHRSGQAGFD